MKLFRYHSAYTRTKQHAASKLIPYLFQSSFPMFSPKLSPTLLQNMQATAKPKNATIVNTSTSLPSSDPALVSAGGGENVVGVVNAVGPACVFMAEPAGLAKLDVDAKQGVSNAVARNLRVRRLI
jgi:hypothetical protein